MEAGENSLKNFKENDVVVGVDGVKKKFCRSLRRSLWYGVIDIVHEVLGRKNKKTILRQEEFWAVDGISFTLRRGECIGLIGHNGAGKTTLLKMLNGLVLPDDGEISVKGRTCALIALGAGFNPLLSGRENIYVNASVLGLKKSEIDSKYDSIVEFSGIGQFIDAPVQSYSSGMAVRLGFAIAAHMEPDVLLLDEVLAVGDVAFQAKCFNTLAEFRGRGVGFILVSHNMHVISRYSDRVMYLKGGQVEYFGEPESAIVRFIEDMDPGDSTPEGAESEWGVACGSGRIKILDYFFTNKDNEVISVINPSDSVSINLVIESVDAGITNPVIDIVIRNSGDQIFQTTNRSIGQELGGMPRRGLIRIEFENIPINGGNINFFVCLVDGTTNEIFDWKRNMSLKVRRSGKHNSSLVVPVQFFTSVEELSPRNGRCNMKI